MDTRDMAKEVRLANWARVLRERRDSGLSVRCYCQEQGITEKTYYYWQRRLRIATCNKLEEQTNAATHREMTTFAALPITSSRSSGNIVIRLNGTEIEIHSGAEPAAIDTVLRIIREC